MSFTVNPLDYEGAAEVVDLDCSRPLDTANFTALWQTCLTYPILAIRDQNLTAKQQVDFSLQFGAIEDIGNARYRHPDEPLVLVLSNELGADGLPIGVVDAGDFLHSDLSTRERPSKMTILQAVQNPQHGGETEFVNMYRILDEMPDDLRHAIEGKFAYHHTSKLKNKRVAISGDRPDAAELYAKLEQTQPDVLQPVVRTHPETGRQALYVSPRFTLRIDGLSEADSDALLDRLFAFMRERRFLYRYKWRDGDLTMWDNRCLTHRATGGYVLPDIRRMHRTSIAGDKAFYDPDAAPHTALAR
jgi:taurine dioxygenase